MNFNFLFQVTGSCLLLLCVYMIVVWQITCTHRHLDFVIISWWYLRFWIYVHIVFGHGRKLSSLRLFSASLHYSYLTAKTSTSLCRSKTHSSSQALVTRLTLCPTHAMHERLQNTCYDIFVPAYNLSHCAWMRYRYINNRRWVMFLASKTEDNHILSLKVPCRLG